jgi:hypothetical protein
VSDVNDRFAFETVITSGVGVAVGVAVACGVGVAVGVEVMAGAGVAGATLTTPPHATGKIARASAITTPDARKDRTAMLGIPFVRDLTLAQKESVQ